MDRDLNNPDNILGLYILDAAGEPVECQDVLAWGRWREANRELMSIARDELADGHVVSTVFLGIDHVHARMFGGKPQLYETGVIDSLEADTVVCARYATRQQALDGHQHALTALKLYLAEGGDDDQG